MSSCGADLEGICRNFVRTDAVINIFKSKSDHKGQMVFPAPELILNSFLKITRGELKTVFYLKCASPLTLE